MYPDARAVRGFVADADTGSGLGGLTIELWSASGHGPELIAEGQSDDTGFFRCAVPPERFGDDDFVDIELRVLDAGRQILSDVHPLPAAGRAETIELSVPRSLTHASSLPSDLPTELDAPRESYPAASGTVSGRIRGAVPEGARVRAVVKTLREGSIHEEVAAEGAVDDAGHYQLSYDRPGTDDLSDNSLHIQLYGAGEALIAESAPLPGPPAQARIDVRTRPSGPEPSEFALIEQQLGEGLRSGVSGLEGVDESVIEEVSNWIDVDPDHLRMFQQAHALGKDAELPPPIFYALQRGGAPAAPGDWIDVPVHELRTTITEAAADGIVDGESIADVDAAVDRLADYVVDRALRDPATRPVLADVLAAADLPDETIDAALRMYQKRPAGATEFWESLGEDAESTGGLDAADAREVREAIKVSEMIGPDIPVLERTYAWRRDGRWQKAEDLCRIGFDDWCELLEEVESAEGGTENGGAPEDAESDEDARDRIEERAEAIVDTLEENFPNRFLHDRFVESEDLSEAARGLLERAPDHDFHRRSIRDRIAGEPALAEGLDESAIEAAIEEVEAVERVSRCHRSRRRRRRARRHRDAIGDGHRLDVRERQFIELYAEALGGRAQASRVHAQAQQTAAGSKLAALRLLQSMQHAPFVLGAPPPDAIKDARCQDAVSGGRRLLRLRALRLGLQSRRVLRGPAALPERQHARAPGADQEPADAIPTRRPRLSRRSRNSSRSTCCSARRPDLAELPLTCENTLTPLPYIDLVNELLEARITGESAAYDTGKTPADVLRAVPQTPVARGVPGAAAGGPSAHASVPSAARSWRAPISRISA